MTDEEYETPGFKEFPKIARLHNGNIVVTEKIDGTNAQIYIEKSPGMEPLAALEGAWCIQAKHTGDEFNYQMLVGSRNRWLFERQDNFGFWKWANDNARELMLGLGEGRHFGEWWGKGIQRGYGQREKTFSLFNVGRWYDPRMDNKIEAEDSEYPHAIPSIGGLSTVPVLYYGPWFGRAADPVAEAMRRLEYSGSTLDPATPAEGVVVFHEASRQYFKAPFDKNHKGAV